MAFLFIAGFFLFFTSVPGHSGVIALPQTGQTVCYDSLGDIIPCLGTGQDGDILAGVAWPNPRFEIDQSLPALSTILRGSCGPVIRLRSPLIGNRE